MNRTAIHEAGHFLMFLKEAIKCTTPLKKGTYYWTYDKFCERHIVQLCIRPNIKKGMGGFFTHYIPTHIKYNDINVNLGGMAAVYAFRKKKPNFSKLNLWWYRFFEGCEGDIRKVKKTGISDAEIVRIVNELISELSDNDKVFINEVISEISKVRHSNLPNLSHPKGILYKQHLKRLSNRYKEIVKAKTL